MPEIKYQALKNYLNDLGKDPESNRVASVYLIYGEELLYKTAFEALIAALIPDSAQSLNYESIEGTNENIHEAIQRVNTFSLSPGKKIVAFRDAQIFYSKQDENRLLERAKQAHDHSDIEKAAKYLLSFMGLLNLSFDDIQKTNRKKTLRLHLDRFSDDKWLDEIISCCVENSMSIPSGADNISLLQKVIEKGFPRGNHLIITTDMVDKRRKLFQTILNNGLIIDCSVPQGDRRADKMAQEAVLKEKMTESLENSGKTMDIAAYSALYEMTGFALRTFSNNLEKLVDYVGDRKEITADDVIAVLKRTKKDPIYDFTNAITDKDIGKTLFYLDSLLSGGDIDHPLQLLSATVNQIRRLLLIKDFVKSPYGIHWHADAPYNHFKSRIMPEIQAFDKGILNQIRDWEEMLSNNGDADTEKEKGKVIEKKRAKQAKTITDLVIVKNPNNPYPVYQMLKKSEKFTIDELLSAMECLSEADLRLKTTGQHPRIVLEDMIFRICS